jgi:hypothetical protein
LSQTFSPFLKVVNEPGKRAFILARAPQSPGNGYLLGCKNLCPCNLSQSLPVVMSRHGNVQHFQWPFHDHFQLWKRCLVLCPCVHVQCDMSQGVWGLAINLVHVMSRLYFHMTGSNVNWKCYTRLCPLEMDTWTWITLYSKCVHWTWTHDIGNGHMEMDICPCQQTMSTLYVQVQISCPIIHPRIYPYINHNPDPVLTTLHIKIYASLRRRARFFGDPCSSL